VGRTLSKLEDTQKAGAPGKIHIIAADVAKVAEVMRIAETADRVLGRVDILVNNAAMYPRKGFLESAPEEWAYVIETNVNGMAFCCRCFLPGMLDRGFGRIINIGTFAWLKPIEKSSAYSASKGAVRPFTRAIATEIDRGRFPNVLINELIPGQFRTAMGDRGGDPRDAFQHVMFVASLPSGGPHGETFDQSTLYREPQGVRARIAGSLAATMRKLRGA
jgi:NAD(P)-dependent dehydrogenase (short-subunit alcohol dehydrogenase family)